MVSTLQFNCNWRSYSIGDDITMGTNTAGNLLVADGTNFNSIAAGSLSEISTVANDDVFIAVDTSGGGLKKIARSAIVAGLSYIRCNIKCSRRYFTSIRW